MTYRLNGEINMKTIKIEQNGVETMSFQIPENASVKIDDKVIVVEPEFKKGNILFAALKHF